MIKKANQLIPGDVILWNGQPEIVEYIEPATLAKYIKLHSWGFARRFENEATFLVSERYQANLIGNKLKWMVDNEQT